MSPKLFEAKKGCLLVLRLGQPFLEIRIFCVITDYQKIYLLFYINTGRYTRMESYVYHRVFVMVKVKNCATKQMFLQALIRG